MQGVSSDIGRPGRAPSARRDGLVTVAALAAVLAWDISGLDLWVAHLAGEANGFAWRQAWLTRSLMHDGGRWLAWGVLLTLVWRALRARASDELGAPSRWQALFAVLLCVLAVPALKQWSLTSCPAELEAFGGTARWVSHWAWGVGDGGPGRCFPSGHAVAAFAFFPMALAWRERHPRIATGWFLAIMGVGLAFGATQVVRGEHFVSHVAWSAWICWAIAISVHQALRWRSTIRAASTAPPPPAHVGKPGAHGWPEARRQASALRRPSPRGQRLPRRGSSSGCPPR